MDDNTMPDEVRFGAASKEALLALLLPVAVHDGHVLRQRLCVEELLAVNAAFASGLCECSRRFSSRNTHSCTIMALQDVYDVLLESKEK